MLRLSSFVVAVMLAVGLAPVTAAAQQRLVVFGMVQWTNPNSIQIIADSGQSVSVDISQIPQSSYQGLRGGERVRVVGYVAADRTRRLIAESLEIGDASSGYWTFPQTS